MRKLSLFTLLAAVMMLSGCELIGDIFQVGMSVGIFLVVAILVVIVGIFYWIRRS